MSHRRELVRNQEKTDGFKVEIEPQLTILILEYGIVTYKDTVKVKKNLFVNILRKFWKTRIKGTVRLVL